MTFRTSSRRSAPRSSTCTARNRVSPGCGNDWTRPIAQFADPEMRTTVQFSGPLSVVDAELADHAEAVVREAVSNCRSPRGATTLAINVVVEDELRIEVADNGCGVPPDITGSGLTNLRQRADDVGGSFTVEALPTGGTKLRWCAPLP